MEIDDWQQAVVDARSFIARWGEQAEKLGWTAKDLFGLFPGPSEATSDFPTTLTIRRNWTHLAAARPTRCCLTAESAAIESRTGAITIYRKNNKPGYGPVGDSLDDISA